MAIHTGNDSHHWLVYRTGDRMYHGPVYHLGLTGVAKFNNLRSDLQRSRDGRITTWSRPFSIHCRSALRQIPVPPKSGYVPRFRIKSWNAYGGLNEIFNDNKANDSRYGVTSLRLSTASTTTGSLTALYTAQLSDLQKNVSSSFGLLTYDYESNAYIYRIGYQVDLLVYWDGSYVRA